MHPNRSSTTRYWQYFTPLVGLGVACQVSSQFLLMVAENAGAATSITALEQASATLLLEISQLCILTGCWARLGQCVGVWALRYAKPIAELPHLPEKSRYH